MFLALKIKLLGWLDQNPSNVNPAKRLFAYLIDWFLGALCMMLPLCLAWMFITHDQENMTSVNIFSLADVSSASLALAVGALALIFALFYYIWIPYKVYPGQTIGKKNMGIKIEKADGSKLGFKDILLRQGLGLLILEGILFNPSRLWQDMISLSTGLNFSGYLLYAGIAVTVISIFLAVISNSKRMLHDYLANTKEKEVAFHRADQMI